MHRHRRRDSGRHRRRVLPERSVLEAPLPGRHLRHDQHRRHGAGPSAGERPSALPEPLDPHAQVPARGATRARHVRLDRRVRRLAQLGMGRGRRAQSLQRRHSPGHELGQHLPVRRRDGGLLRAGWAANRDRPDHPRDEGDRVVVSETVTRDPRTGLLRRQRLHRASEVGPRHGCALRLDAPRHRALRHGSHRAPGRDRRLSRAVGRALQHLRARHLADAGLDGHAVPAVPHRQVAPHQATAQRLRVGPGTADHFRAHPAA